MPRRIAYLHAAHTRRCELIMHDSFHRQLHHELIDAHHTPPEKEKIARRPTGG
jgi:hypothetical protein